MQRNVSSYMRLVVTAALLFIGINIYSAPLTWFPGPSLYTAFSGGASVSDSSLGNIVIGGDGNLLFPENLVATNSNWSFLPEFFDSYFGSAAVDEGDIILLYGGTDGTNSTSAAFGYSPSGDSSPTIASMSVARSLLGYAPDASGNAYAIGGLDANGHPLSSAERYNQDANSWSAVASLPVALYNFPAVFDRTNQIYVFGGYTNTTLGGEVATAFRYSVRSNKWTAIASMPIATANSAAAFGADGKIYVVGGVSGGVPIDTVQVYNPASNSWSISTPLPEPLTASAMGVDSLGRLIVMGGMDTNGYDVGDVWRSQQLGIPDSPPVFTKYPATNGIYGQSYSSVIAATGNPQPTYSIVDGPTGMAVDLYSGAITWTPQGGSQIGNIPVTIQASNYAGSTNWTFNITVPPPPPIIPTNVTVVSVNDNSVTLSWTPESPLVGTVTYKIYRVTSSGGGKGGSHAVYGLYATSTTNTVTLALVGSSSYTFVVTATAGSYTTGYSLWIGVIPTVPQPPPNVRLTGLTSTTLSLAWDPSPGPAQSANYSAIVGYSISQYIPYYGGYTLVPKVTSIPTNTTSGTVIGITPGTSAFWIVQSVDGQGYASSAIYNILAISNPIPSAAQMTATTRPIGGSFQFSASEGGAVLQTVLIQATTNPADPNSWQQIGSVFPGANPFTFTDTNAWQYPLRFYRIVAQ
jgi:N-acetylneuraminic acid mutarotase